MIQHEILEPLTLLWWQVTLGAATIITIILLYARSLNKSQIEMLAKIVGVIMIARAIFIHPYGAYLGRWYVQDSLPLHICGLSSIMAGIIMFYRKQWMYELLYFWGIPGAFHSILTPEFTQGMDGWLFYDYYLAHGGIIFSALFCTFFLGFRPRRGSWWRIFLYSQLLFPVLGMINWLLDANYMYLCKPPIVENPFVIGEFPFHLIGLEVAGLIHFFIVYLPFGLKYRRQYETSEPGVI